MVEVCLAEGEDKLDPSGESIRGMADLRVLVMPFFLKNVSE